MKTCFKCGVPQPLSNFYRHPRMADGHLGKCKSCTKADVNSNYASRRKQYSEYEHQRNQDEGRRSRKRLYEAKHRQNNPDKAKARNAVSNAIRDGKLERGPCEVVGCNNKAQAHHDDYSQPFQIRWLCFKHHRELAHLQTTSS